VYRPLQFHERSQHFIGAHSEIAFRRRGGSENGAIDGRVPKVLTIKTRHRFSVGTDRDCFRHNQRQEGGGGTGNVSP
jgi:hypothetical protein